MPSCSESLSAWNWIIFERFCRLAARFIKSQQLYSFHHKPENQRKGRGGGGGEWCRGRSTGFGRGNSRQFFLHRFPRIFSSLTPFCLYLVTPQILIYHLFPSNESVCAILLGIGTGDGEINKAPTLPSSSFGVKRDRQMNAWHLGRCRKHIHGGGQHKAKGEDCEWGQGRVLGEVMSELNTEG